MIKQENDRHYYSIPFLVRSSKFEGFIIEVKIKLIALIHSTPKELS